MYFLKRKINNAENSISNASIMNPHFKRVKDDARETVVELISGYASIKFTIEKFSK